MGIYWIGSDDRPVSDDDYLPPRRCDRLCLVVWTLLLAGCVACWGGIVYLVGYLAGAW
jgi:hypothetical protein